MMSVATRPPTPRRLGGRGTPGGVAPLRRRHAAWPLLPHLAVILYSLKTEWQYTVLPAGLTLEHHRAILTDPRWAG